MDVVIAALRAGHSRKSAWSKAQIPENTFNSWLYRGRKEGAASHYVKFVAGVEGAEGEAEARYASVVFKEADAGNWRAAMFILSKRYHWTDRFQLGAEVETEKAKVGIERARADIEFTKARTRRIEESGDEAVLDRLRVILDEERDQVKAETGAKAIN
jgi:transposase